MTFSTNDQTTTTPSTPRDDSKIYLNDHYISTVVGSGNGRLQRYLMLFLVIFAGPFAAFTNMAQFLILFEPEYQCRKPYVDLVDNPTSNYSYNNQPFDSLSTSTIERISSFDISNFSQPSLADVDYTPDVDSGVTIHKRKRNILSLHLELTRKCGIDNLTHCPNGYEYSYDFIYPTVVSEVRPFFYHHLDHNHTLS